ncbi:MAG: type II secretion system protein [Rhodospirillales bacterium]|nr:type II secretion system protein [Acetobacter sp.]
MYSELSLTQARVFHRAFTLIELLVVIAIIAVLAGIAMPVISNVKESGNSAKCTSNLKQIGAALNLYANDNNNQYPPLELPTDTTVNWDTYYINPYLPERTNSATNTGRQSLIFICPSAVYKGNNNSDLSRTYTATECMVGPGNKWTLANSRNNFASQVGTLVLFDAAQNGTNRYCAPETTWDVVNGSGDLLANGRTSTYIDYRHHNAFHGLFADGHVDTITRARASTVVTKAMWTGKAQ